MTNPNPELITDEMWRLWTDRPNSTWKLSGFYADKPGYHNTVNANLKKWPDHYSVQLPLDRVTFNRNKARAIDLTMTQTEMIRWTTRMRTAALNPADIRLDAVKEFFGTLDGVTVFGLSKDVKHGTWRRVTANKTHLWHGHTGIFAAYVDIPFMINPILSVWKGETFEQWKEDSVERQIAEVGDTGQAITYWQYIHNSVRGTVTPASPLVVTDGEYGPKFAAAVLDFWKKRGGVGTTYKGTYITGWLATEYQEAYAKISVPTLPSNPEELIKEAVNKWMDENFTSPKLKITGTIEGYVSTYEE